MGRRRVRQQLGADLGPQMARDAEAAHVGHRAGAQPSRDPANLHHVEHYVVGGPRVDRVTEISDAPPVLARLYRCSDLARYRGMPGIIVRQCWLLDPFESFAVEDP